MIFFGQSIVRLRPTLVEDRYGDTVEDWNDPLEQLFERVSVQPNVQQESEDATRNTTVTGWRVQSAPGVDLDIVASDRIRFDGVICRVIGEVARWPSPLTGGVHHVEFSIERRTG